MVNSQLLISNLRIENLKLDRAAFLEVVNQLKKDIALCGIDRNSEFLSESMNAFLLEFTDFTMKLKKHEHSWKALLYRVDLPSEIDMNALSHEEQAQLIILRSYQKCLIRKQFSKSQDNTSNGPSPLL